jgi:FixJ family two-component response regulator
MLSRSNEQAMNVAIPHDDQEDSRSVHLILRDEKDCSRLVSLLESISLDSYAYRSGSDFLDLCKSRQISRHPSCLITNLRMRHISGLALLRELNELCPWIPVIVVSSCADVPSAVEAMKLGAFDFFESLYDTQPLLETVHGAMALSARRIERLARLEVLRSRKALLTTRETEVMACLIRGLRNPEIAAHLGITKRTVELHRQRVMAKMQARSIAELVSLEYSLVAASKREP